MKRNLLSLLELSRNDILTLLDMADKMKRSRGRVRSKGNMERKSLALLFQKSSTRTRVSFEVAMYELGGYTIFLNTSDLQLSRGESIEDTARTLSKYVNVVAVRVYDHKDVEVFASASTIPVINALSSNHHPCQALSDLMTIREIKGTLSGIKIAWIGDANNVCNDLMVGAMKLGADFSIASPNKYRPNKKLVEKAKMDAASDANLKLLFNPVDAVRYADVIVTDSYVSMGSESERNLRLKAFLPKYQVTDSLLRGAGKDAIFMHCLPAKRGEEVTGDVIDGRSSVVWQQAENKLHIHKALLADILK